MQIKINTFFCCGCKWDVIHNQWKPHHQDAVGNQEESVSDVDLHVIYA